MTTKQASASVSSPSHDTVIRLARLIDGYLSTQLIYVAVRLGIAEQLASGERSSDDLARLAGVDAKRLHRLLRGLAAIEVLEERRDGNFALTVLGQVLRRDSHASMHGPARIRGELYFPAARHLFDSLIDGDVPFEREYGSDLFSYLQQETDAGTFFQESMAARSRREAERVVAARDFTGFRRIVDVGGGTGLLLEAILRSSPVSTGVLFDLPQVVELARARLSGSEVADRIEFAGGSFFESVTTGGDLYLLSRVIHDWNDDDASRILRTVKRAMEPGATLLLVEAVLPERAVDQPSTISMDLHMLLMLGGEERTAGSFQRLLAATGFELVEIVPDRSALGISLIEARPV
jgi:hypothetical protein